jgi:hypothetical protein
MRNSGVTLFDCRIADAMQNKVTACSGWDGGGTPQLALEANLFALGRACQKDEKHESGVPAWHRVLGLGFRGDANPGEVSRLRGDSEDR